ncbi:uncharacterized protein I303_100813 [Kwoniella dejecticola CBS 10117]|uniref:SGT1-domain-containing protein n=1 Tax=Kwoniella dejecticola CBS 10117 TaxID=1296121 RepID=A0A1A6AFZ8_9TREE|nr:uncharacterized protein I303_00815 [Kwoniella dejecticola CBS 10117]OBR88995.1 hypothetical protein I303_00815 [Kwoniella dejecticola CBS 10117]
MSSAFPSLAHTPRAFPLPTIAEDTLHYALHLPPTYEPTSTALLLTQYVESLLIQPWLWNKDSWELKASDTGNKLEGTMRVGDAVDDEWLVVWLLKKISEKRKDIVIGVRDTDGEFLLIEAANDLPAWVSPENAENRLWLQGGHLHLIPLSVRSTKSKPLTIPDDEDMEKQYDPEAYISEEDAIQAVRAGKYRADETLEKAIWDRISCYPDGLKTHQHKTKAYLPISIAKALKHNPELIQRAVEGFYVRDPSQLRTAARMTHFPPSASILTPILLTRAAFAQLQGQVFHPPRIFGPEWHVPDNPNNEGEKRWRDLGVKISTGFEIMYKEGGKKGRHSNAFAADSLNQDEGYKAFLDNLKKAGWFGDELEGSEKWQAREKEAMKGYQNVKSADTAAQRPAFAHLVDAAISLSDTPIEALSVDPTYPEDSESWLEVSPDELDGMMMRASGRAGPSVVPGEDEKAELGEEHGQALQDLAKKVEDFVGGQGDLTGARFEDELSDEDMGDSEDEAEDETTLRKALEAEKDSRLKDLVPSLPAEEWGSKSQATPSSTAATPIDIDDQSNVPTGKAKKTKGQKEVKFDHRDIHSASMRPPRFAKQEYDGVVSESSDEGEESESELPPVGTLGRKIAQMKWSEGDVDRAEPKIKEIDDDDQAQEDKLDLDEEMQRRVWGDGNDEDEGEDEEDDDDGMKIVIEEEQEDFLKFAKDALGINDDLWKGILGDRQARGAFIPSNGQANELASQDVPNTAAAASKKVDAPTKAEAKKVQFASSASVSNVADTSTAGPQSDPSLASFESVMRAMDDELSKNRNKGKNQAPSSKPKFNPKVKSKPKPKQTTKRKVSSNKSSNDGNGLPPLPTEEDLEAMDEDDLLAMDRELKAALKNAGISDDESDDELHEGVKELGEDDKREYEMMKHFLESYRSQSGQSGVVGNLFGRLGQGQK